MPEARSSSDVKYHSNSDLTDCFYRSSASFQSTQRKLCPRHGCRALTCSHKLHLHLQNGLFWEIFTLKTLQHPSTMPEHAGASHCMWCKAEPCGCSSKHPAARLELSQRKTDSFPWALGSSRLHTQGTQRPIVLPTTSRDLLIQCYCHFVLHALLRTSLKY